MMTLPLRQDLNVEETWDLSLLFGNQEAYEAELEQIKQDIEDFVKRFHNKLQDTETIVEAIISFNELQARLSPVYTYGRLGYTVDRNNEVYEMNVSRIDLFSEWVGKNLAFFEPQLASLTDEQFLEVKNHPEMEEYQAYFKDLERRRPTFFDADKEAMLSALNGTIFGQEDLYASLKFQDLTFDDFTAGGKSYGNSFAGFEQDYEVHPSYEVRHQAWKSFHNGLAKYQHTAATNYIQLVKTEKKMAGLRGFDSVIDYLLFDQNVDQANYHQIIDTLMSEMAPVMQRYAKLMQAEHGWDKISLADIKASFSVEPAATISIQDSRQIVEEALSVLGEEYSAMVKRAFDQRWIDYPMNQTKSTGGFCSSPYRQPSFILLNWTGLLSEVLVLAHELGHAGHFYFAANHNPILTTDPSLYFVEAPSTCNEVITCQYLLSQPLEDKAKRSLIAEFISRTYFHNMVTHLLEADFQRKVYQAVDRDEILNARVLNTYFKESLQAFWGNALEINPGAELTWMRQPHYFGGLYSYTYSAGLTIGTQMGKRIVSGDPQAVNDWLKVLSAGGSQGPIELAQMAGVDMSNPQAIRQAIAYVDELLDRIEELAK